MMALYVPQLEYVFNLPVLSPIQQHFAVMKYMNEAGLTPAILAGEERILEELRRQGIRFKALGNLPDHYDVMLSLGVGYDPFERYWLEKSMEAGKINVEFVFCCSLNNFVNLFQVPRRTKFLHGVCVPDARTMNHCRAYNKEVIYMVTGLPAWDRFAGEPFRRQVARAKAILGPKLLVIGVTCTVIAKEAAYYRKVICWAEAMGFKVVLQVHPGKEHLLPEDLAQYMNPGLDRFVLFAAASHVIGFIHSGVIPETLFLGTKVGCKPLANNYHGWDECELLDDAEAWRRWALPLFGSDCLRLLPLVHDQTSLAEFLASDRPAVTRRQITELMGFPDVPSFTEHALRTLDAYFGKANAANVQLLLRKSQLSRGLHIDFSWWDIRKDANQFRGVSDFAGFVNAGIRLIREGRFADAHRYLERAEMYSGTAYFGFVQFLKAICRFHLHRFDKAEESIYRALFVQPDCPEYKQLLCRIRSFTEQGRSIAPEGDLAPGRQAIKQPARGI